MSQIVNTTGRTAENIAAEIRTLDTQGKHLCLMYIFEIGKRLEEAKSLVGHGHWGEYLKAQVGYSQDTANKYMKVYREYQNSGVFANSDTFMNLDFSKAYKLLAVPAEEREAFLQEHPVEDMTVRQLEQAIRDRDANLQAAKELSARAEKAEAEVEKLNAAVLQQVEMLEGKDRELSELEENLVDLRRRAEEAATKEKKASANVDGLKRQLAEAKEAEKAAKADLEKAKANPVLPEEQLQKLKAQGAAEAAAKATEELQKQLLEAQVQAAKADKERVEAEAKAAAAQKAAKMSGADAAVFKLLFTQVQEDFNKLMGTLLKVRQADPELGNKLTAAVQAVLDKVESDLRGGRAEG